MIVMIIIIMNAGNMKSVLDIFLDLIINNYDYDHHTTFLPQNQASHPRVMGHHSQ